MVKKIFKRVFVLCLSLTTICLTVAGENCLVFFGEPKTEEQITKESVDELKLFIREKGSF